MEPYWYMFNPRLILFKTPPYPIQDLSIRSGYGLTCYLLPGHCLLVTCQDTLMLHSLRNWSSYPNWYNTLTLTERNSLTFSRLCLSRGRRRSWMRFCSMLRSWVLNRRRLEDPSLSFPEPKKNLSVVRARRGSSSQPRDKVYWSPRSDLVGLRTLLSSSLARSGQLPRRPC